MVRLVAASLTTLLLATLVAASADGAQNRWITKRTWTIAHQGGENEFPSNTLYAFKRALASGADMLELDVGVTRDGQVIVMHDTTVDRVTDGRGLVSGKTLRQIRRLDGAYWFSGGTHPYSHDRARAAYRLRGIATGRRKPPKGFKASDFRVPTLNEVLRAFPKTPINIEVKGRTRSEEISEYVRNAEVLAKLLRGTKRRDLIVVSFKDDAVARFHQLVPAIGTAPGLNGSAAFLLAGTPAPSGSVALQLPVTYDLSGTLVEVASPAFIAKAHSAGLAWHAWFGDRDRDDPATWRMLASRCADGIMTARPRALARVLAKVRRPTVCPTS